MGDGEFHKRVWDLTRKASESKGNSPLYCYPYIKEVIEEAKLDMEKHSIKLNVESEFVKPPAKIANLIAIPESIWLKWFGSKEGDSSG